MSAQKSYEKLVEKEREKGLLEGVSVILDWDEETYMPPGGSRARGETKGLIAKLTHERATNPEIGDLLDAVEKSDLIKDESVAANVRGIRWSYDRQRKLPGRLAEEIAKLSSESIEAWKEARAKSDMKILAPHLNRFIQLRREEADAVGFKKDRYDALLDVYEYRATTEQISGVLSELKPHLTKLIDKVKGSSKRPKKEIMSRSYPVADQRKLSDEVVKLMGFDTKRGRLDTTAHPFCLGLDPDDVRLTTRFNEKDLTESFFSTVHEAGHGLYEQGLNRDQVRLPLGKSASMGIHESQSRLWENLVARSRPFWDFFYLKTKNVFGSMLADVDIDDFVFAANTIETNFIRTSSDELTYNLHIILRFELELAMLSGDLKAEDLPGAWDEKFHSMFGVKPPNQSQGCLQDVHWGVGLMGYFPTYTLGNLYAAQFMETARKEIPDLDGEFRKGNLAVLKKWLNEKIHFHGQRYEPTELCRNVTGKSLSSDALVKHLTAKVQQFYA